MSDVGHSANSAYKAHARVWLLPSHLTPHRSAPLRHGALPSDTGWQAPPLPTRRLGAGACPPESHRSGRRRRSSAVPHRRSNNHGRGEARPPASAGAGNRNPSPRPLPSAAPAVTRTRGSPYAPRAAGSTAPGGCLLASPPRRSACVRGCRESFPSGGGSQSDPVASALRCLSRR